MRIQHNIAAMNSYRNYNNNVKSVNKNLEKLSSGYKINRAGDDAAGLAISEKMRAQITGLDAAQKNVKDGISLVKTAEGAMQEIQDMLNRMDYLATQSANGTYDNEVDRANLQKEVNNLKTEINRIADSANFNGIKLLDGSLSGKSQVKNVSVTESTAVKGKYETDELAATKSGTDLSDKLTTDDIGKTLDYTVTWKTSSGEEKTTTVSLTFQGDGTGAISSTAANNYFTDASGAKYKLNASGELSDQQLHDGFKAGLSQNEEFTSYFEIADSTGGKGFEFTAKIAGTAGAQILSVGVSETTTLKKDDIYDARATQTGENGVEIKKDPLDAMHKFDVTKLEVAQASETKENIAKHIFEVDGHKFLLHKDLTDDQIKALDSDVNVIKVAGTTPSGAASAEMKEIAAHISKVTGLATTVYDAANTDANITTNDIVFTKDKLKLNGNSLRLQIGDTADNFNQMDVKIGDMHTVALGIDQIDIGNQDGAAAAIEKIKAAINSVSSVRGDLGAIQNRLDHTANNLSVMQENIQDAESTIRDTDVADEMMSYTKNNILIQSAQAMLAQANQIPQGVLQLLG